MDSLLRELFAFVCSQGLEHTWAPGGIPLPFCQRCTGLYVGAAVAVAVQLSLRTRPDQRLLWLYLVFLLQMVPLGFHLVPQGPFLRTLSGQVFGFALVGYLLLLPEAYEMIERRAGTWRVWTQVGTLLATVFLLPALSMWGGQASWILLSTLGSLGLLSLALLALVNSGLLLAPVIDLLGSAARRSS